MLNLALILWDDSPIADVHMLKLIKHLLAIPVALVVFAAPPLAETDKEIKQILIRESIASHSGSCPCPYNLDRAGRSCGKPGGMPFRFSKSGRGS